MTPEAARRGKVHIPVMGVTFSAWTAVILFTAGRSTPSFCSADFWQSISGDRLAYAIDTVNIQNEIAALFTMLLAMMLPLLSLSITHIYSRSFPRRRARAIGLFVVFYFSVWLAAMVPLSAVAIVLKLLPVTSWSVFAFALFIALVWQCSPAKQVALNRCHSRPALSAFGLQADFAAFRYGLKYGFWCAASCWPLMLMTQVLSDGDIQIMVAVSIFLWLERLEDPALPRWKLRYPLKTLNFLRYQMRSRLSYMASIVN